MFFRIFQKKVAFADAFCFARGPPRPPVPPLPPLRARAASSRIFRSQRSSDLSASGHCWPFSKAVNALLAVIRLPRKDRDTTPTQQLPPDMDRTQRQPNSADWSKQKPIKGSHHLPGCFCRRHLLCFSWTLLLPKSDLTCIDTNLNLAFPSNSAAPNTMTSFEPFSPVRSNRCPRTCRRQLFPFGPLRPVALSMLSVRIRSTTASACCHWPLAPQALTTALLGSACQRLWGSAYHGP